MDNAKSSQPSYLFLDFETRSTCDLRKSGAEVYARHPSTDILCVGWACVGDNPVVQSAKDFKARAATDYDFLVAHNAPFEIAIWNNVGVKKYGWPKLPAAKFICTMARAYAMSLPGALENVAPAVGLDIQKDMAGNRLMLQLSKPRSYDERNRPVWWDNPAKTQRLFEYCGKDIEVTQELFKRLCALSEDEHEVWLLDQEINQRGIQIDLESVDAALALVDYEQKYLDSEMRNVTDDAVATCTAVASLTQWIRYKGVEIDGVAKDEVTELLTKTDLPESVRKALTLRQSAAKSSTAKLASMRNRICSDSRIRGIFQYYGANTGRWAGRGIQPHNFPRPKLQNNDIGRIFKILNS